MSDSENEDEKKPTEPTEDTSLANSDVVTKYQEAAKITNSTLLEIIAMCVPGTKVIDVCRAGDEMIVAKLSSVYKTKQKGKLIDKGIAFPVCLSVNECVCHYSPLESDTVQYQLVPGDMVKIDLGCHIDGYIAVTAHTIIVGFDGTAETPLNGPKADLFHAAYAAAEVASRIVKPGGTNTKVTEIMKKVAESYGVQFISGTLMHQMKRYVIDGNKMILLREETENKVETCTFEPNEVYAVDIAVSTGDGKPRELDTRTTVFKRVVDKVYSLRIKSSRTFFNEVNKNFPTLPFSIRSFSDERNARMGVRECVDHNLIVPYPVLYERPNDSIVHLKFTLLLLPGGNIKITGLPIPNFIVSEKTISDEIKTVLEENPEKKKKDRKKKSNAAKKTEESS